MNCEELFQLLPGYLDAEMKREICLDLEAHMRQCSYCRAHVHTMQGTVDLARDLGTAPRIHQEWVTQLRARICGGHGLDPS
jgi:predicted anti-sigma-YlaC factor YlaD